MDQFAHLNRASIFDARPINWLAEGIPLGGVTVGWGGEDDLDADLLSLGLEVSAADDACSKWRGRRVMARGAAAMIFGSERVVEGVSARSILLPSSGGRPSIRRIGKLFCNDGGKYELTRDGLGLQASLFAVNDLRLVVISDLAPFLPRGFGRDGESLPALAWLSSLARETGAAVLVTLDHPDQMRRMWRGGLRLAADRTGSLGRGGRCH